MRGTFIDRLAHTLRRRRRTIAIGALACAVLPMLLAPGPAAAGLDHELSVFSDCPLAVPRVEACVYSTVTSGEFKMGSKTIPVDKTITLQGGLKEESNELVPAADGNTLSKTPLTVVGGLVGVELILTEVTATAELAGPVLLNSTNIARGGVSMLLPLKAKLDTPLPVLGPSCYVGTPSVPISLELTTGTTSPPPPNKPISGHTGTLTFAADGKIDRFSGVALADNSFAAPGVSGCGLVPLVTDPVVDLTAGLPASAGQNTAIMSGATLELVNKEKLEAQLALPSIGRCVKAAKKATGAYFDSKCTSLAQKEGNFEWVEGPGPKPKFTSTGSASTLQGVGGAIVKCTHTSSSGQYTGAKSLTATLTFTGCANSKKPCQSSGAASGEIVSSALSGQLGFIKDEAVGSELDVSVGVDLSHEPSLLQAECAGSSEPVTVKGSVIGPIGKADAMTSTFSLADAQSGGKQSVESFEEGPKDTLTATLGSGAEQAGLTSKLALKNEEKLEIKQLEE